MKTKITEEQLNQELKRIGFINELAYKIVGRKYNMSPHSIAVKASKMRTKGRLIKLGGRTVKMLNIEELKMIFDDNRDKKDNLETAIKNGLTKEEAEANYLKWKESYMDGVIKPESHIGRLQTTLKKEIKPLESNSSSQNKSTLESTIHSQETCIKQKSELKPYEKELVAKLVEKHSSGPQIVDEFNSMYDSNKIETVTIPKIITLKPVTMEGQNSMYTFNKCGVKVNTLGDTTITPELLQEQKEALGLWNIYYKE